MGERTMNRYLEPPHPNLPLEKQIIRFKYSKPDCCEIPHLRLGRILSISEDRETYTVEQIQPIHGIRKFIRNRIICFEVIEVNLCEEKNP